MKLYRCSRIKTDKVYAQEVIADDYRKFIGEPPQKVIWATQYQNMAWVFGVFWQRMSIKIATRYDSLDSTKLIHEIQVERELREDELSDLVYLYTVDSDGFIAVSEDDTEWYSIEQEITAEVESKTVREALADLQMSADVKIVINPTIGIPPKNSESE